MHELTARPRTNPVQTSQQHTMHAPSTQPSGTDKSVNQLNLTALSLGQNLSESTKRTIMRQAHKQDIRLSFRLSVCLV